MKDQAHNILSQSKPYSLVLGAVSEHMPSMPYLARAKHIHQCTECHRATHLLMCGDTLYFARTAGICLAAYLESHLPQAHQDSQAALVARCLTTRSIYASIRIR